MFKYVCMYACMYVRMYVFTVRFKSMCTPSKFTFKREPWGFVLWNSSQSISCSDNLSMEAKQIISPHFRKNFLDEIFFFVSKVCAHFKKIRFWRRIFHRFQSDFAVFISSSCQFAPYFFLKMSKLRSRFCMTMNAPIWKSHDNLVVLLNAFEDSSGTLIIILSTHSAPSAILDCSE